MLSLAVVWYSAEFDCFLVQRRVLLLSGTAQSFTVVRYSAKFDYCCYSTEFDCSPVQCQDSLLSGTAQSLNVVESYVV